MIAALLVRLAAAAEMSAACVTGSERPSPEQSGLAHYGLVIHFQMPVTSADVNAVETYLRNYDPGMEFLVEESLPPIGHAILETKERDFCVTVEKELESRSYIANIDCRKVGDATPSNGPNVE